MRTFGPNVNNYHDVSDQMIDNLRRRAEAHFRWQEVEKAELTSIAAFEEHRKRVRDHFMTAIGDLPEERTPLNVQCTGSLDRGGFTIEKLIYESLPEFYVTAALYVPKGIESPQPAVVFVHGHSDLGKSYPTYQAVCVDLAANGFVVLAVDPPGQGERFQYFDSEKGSGLSAVVRRSTPTPDYNLRSAVPVLDGISSGMSCAALIIWKRVRRLIRRASA